MAVGGTKRVTKFSTSSKCERVVNMSFTPEHSNNFCMKIILEKKFVDFVYEKNLKSTKNISMDVAVVEWP